MKPTRNVRQENESNRYPDYETENAEKDAKLAVTSTSIISHFHQTMTQSTSTTIILSAIFARNGSKSGIRRIVLISAELTYGEMAMND